MMMCTPCCCRCESGCECGESVINGHTVARSSLLNLHGVYVTQKPECVLSVQVGVSHTAEQYQPARLVVPVRLVAALSATQQSQPLFVALQANTL